jgi:hypothetical protein
MPFGCHNIAIAHVATQVDIALLIGVPSAAAGKGNPAAEIFSPC